MKDLINTSIEAPEWTYGTETTADGEYVSAFTLFRDGALFASIPAEAEGTPYADQESGLKALCAAANAHSALVSVHTAANRVTGLYSAQYIRAHDDGGRVKHAMGQLNTALEAASTAFHA